MLETCRISFTNSRSGDVFTGGDVVSGNINITLIKRKKLLDLTFQVKGETRCRWRECHATGTKNNTVECTSSDIHFKQINSLLTAYERDSNSVVVLKPGNYSFGFSFKIPQDVPTAMEGNYGRVRYTLKVTASRSMRLDDEYKCPITVIGKLDLNSDPSYVVPKKIDVYKAFHTLLANKGHALVRVSLPMIGFVPGQSIQMFCQVKNDSQVTIDGVQFTLVQKKRFTCTTPKTAHREVFEKVVKVRKERVYKQSETSYDVVLRIPSLPPTTLQSGLITTEYFLRVKMIVPGMHINVEEEIPIIIGTVPLTQRNRITAPSAPPAESVASPTEPIAPPTKPTTLPAEPDYSEEPPSYDELAPPTYEESQTSCMMAHPNPDGKDMPFSPVYPVYNIPPAQYPHQIGFIVPKE